MPNEIGSGPGVERKGSDTTRGARPGIPGGPQSGFGTGGGVRNAGEAGGTPSTPAGQPATRRSDAGAPNTGPGAPTSGPGDGGGVRSVPSRGEGRGGPGAAPASARRLVGVGQAPQVGRVLEQRSVPPTGTLPQEQAQLQGG